MSELLNGLAILCSFAAASAVICAVMFWLIGFIRASYRHAFPKPEKSREYGNENTIHQTKHVDVEVCNGEVVAVWFRCQPLPFVAVNVMPDRSAEMRKLYGPLTHSICELQAVTVKDLR